MATPCTARTCRRERVSSVETFASAGLVLLDGEAAGRCGSGDVASRAAAGAAGPGDVASRAAAGAAGPGDVASRTAGRSLTAPTWKTASASPITPGRCAILMRVM